jgi:hypothetical protein
MLTEIEPPFAVVTVTVPLGNPAAICAAGVVTAPPTLPVEVTLTPAPFGALAVPAAGAPAFAIGALAGGAGGGANVPPVGPELEPVFTPLLSDPLFVGAVSKLARSPPCRCADAGAAHSNSAPTPNAATRDQKVSETLVLRILSDINVYQ